MRKALLCTVGLLAVAFGQDVKGLKIMAPAAPGGGWDQTSRAIQKVLESEGIASGVQVYNVPGAGGTIGLAQFANLKGQGNNLMTMGLVMVGAIQTNKSKVSLKQVTPIARLTGEFEVLVVPTSSPFKNMDDLVAAWKADPGKVAIAGGSAGGTDHILAGLIADKVGVPTNKVNYVPFAGGGEALAALLGNQVAVGISGFGEFEAQIKAGQLRALAISSPKRVEGINIPTLREQKIPVDLANWRGIVAPPNLPADEKAKLVAAMDKLHASAEWKSILKQRKWEDLYLSGNEYVIFLRNEDARIQKVLKSIGLIK